MTLIFQNMAMNNASSSKSGTTSGKVSSDSTVNVIEGSNVLAEHTFSQMMGEGSAPTTILTSSDVASLLEGLLQNVPVQGTTSTESDLLNQLLQGFTDEITKVDEAIEADPSLMLLLKGWLQQVNTLLISHETEDGGADQSALLSNMLAEQPETIRFAVQDAVSQLLSMLPKNDLTSNSSSQAIQLLASVHNLLQQVDKDEPQTAVIPVEVTDKEGAKGSVLLQSNVNKLAQADGTTIPNKTEMVVNSNGSQVLTPMKLDQLIRVLQGTASIPSDEDVAITVQKSVATESTELTPDQGILTAGELLMREGIKNPLKAAPVPVEKFPEEVAKLLVSKLDIVKLNGMTEAKISLYPEHLGQVDIKITMSNGQLIATFMTEHAGAKGLLEQQMSQLRTALQSQGLQVERLEVTQNQSLQSHMYNEGRQPSAGQQQSNQRSKEREDQTDDSLAVAELTEEMNDWLSEQVNGEQGNTFTAKA
ncbi:flagellar hook-length control protein FliK [Paenibacillus sp. FA6]|uniref:flagellar hook-length control protein FliK n=1 Tax=Paenibacillus sp. FA6 TaxID=3413029 RepID=UPI003F65F4B9